MDTTYRATRANSLPAEDDWATAPNIMKTNLRSIIDFVTHYGAHHHVDASPCVRFAITGGTDDPALELRLLMMPETERSNGNISVYPPPMTVIKFHLLPHSAHACYKPATRREVHPFHPQSSSQCPSLTESPTTQAQYPHQIPPWKSRISFMKEIFPTRRQ
jgi:hypothetical protein